MKTMGLIAILLVFSFSILFMGCVSESPEASLAKQQLQNATAHYDALQSKINAIPSLELSSNVKKDLQIQVAYLDFVGTLIPDVEESIAKTHMPLVSAFAARDSPLLSLDLDKGPGTIFEAALNVSKVMTEDLNELEKLANTYDSALYLAKAAAQEPLPPLTVNRTSDTEQYFVEYEKLSNRYDALVDSLNRYNTSTSFRDKIARLKEANNAFGDIAIYTHDMFTSGKGPSIPTFNLAETFPAVAEEETQYKSCFTEERDPTMCNESNLFVGLLHPLFQKLKVEYTKLLE